MYVALSGRNDGFYRILTQGVAIGLDYIAPSVRSDVR